jgi:hypothetical protein
MWLGQTEGHRVGTTENLEQKCVKWLILGKMTDKEPEQQWRAIEEGALKLETGMATRKSSSGKLELRRARVEPIGEACSFKLIYRFC